MALLKCSKCSEMKSADSFYRRSDRPRGRGSKCKSCVGNSSKQVREWRQSNPEKAALGRKRERVLIYKMSIEEYDAKLAEQGNRCAICLAGKPDGKGAWHIDHCHETGSVRGLLCTRCNSGLGYFKDNRANLERANAYLEAHDAA